LGAPFDLAHGVDPKEPKTVLEEPSAEILNATLRLWRLKKKASSITLVIDTSGSMNEDEKIQNAKAGALDFLNLLGDADTFSLIPFNSQIFATGKNMLLKDFRKPIKESMEAFVCQSWAGSAGKRRMECDRRETGMGPFQIWAYPPKQVE
jgi:Ca-activated chloride channel homolog